MSIVLHIEGLDDVLNMVNPDNFDRAIDKAMDRSASFLRDHTKQLPAVSAKTTGYTAKGIPVDTGRMRQNIYSKRLSLLAAGVVSPVHYSDYIHQGTSRMPPRPFFDWSLELGGLKGIEEIFTSALKDVG